MKFALSIAIVLVILSSVPTKAFQDAATVQASASSATNVQTGQSTVGTNASASASADANLRPVQGELVSKIDSKSAKVGDEVVLKTKDKMETASGTVIPKGSRIVGHVTEVQVHGNGHADSRLSLAFDRADLKSGQSVAIHSVIRTVAPPVGVDSSVTGDDSLSAGPSAGSMAGGGHSMGGGRVGGLAGSAVGSTSAVAGNTAGSIGAGAGTNAGTALRTTGDLATDSTTAAGDGMRGSAGAATSFTAHATSIPGVMLKSDSSAATSGTLSVAKHNVRLDSGTQFTLGIAAATTTMR